VDNDAPYGCEPPAHLTFRNNAAISEVIPKMPKSANAQKSPYRRIDFHEAQSDWTGPIKPTDLILRSRAKARRLEGRTLARSRLWPSFETRASKSAVADFDNH
jgi:hypothetical protein